jgi:molybdopterin converting factor subunit 1
MRVKVLFFALYREQTGLEATQLELPTGTTIQQARQQLQTLYPRLSLAGGVAAVNQQFAQPSRELQDGDELALLPPVSGGQAEPEDWCGLTADPLELQTWVDWATAPPYGAVLSFLGTTRTPNKGLEVTYLEYEAFAPMAQQVMEQMCAEMRQRWVLGRIAIWHRTGRVYPAEASILIVVSSPHRPEAFEACRYAIERVKQILPVWKKEFLADGSHWVEGFSPPDLRLS